MSLTITKISNLFNIISQEIAEINNYHFGFRSDVNRNVKNNFDIKQSTGKLYPAVHFAVPTTVGLVDPDNNTKTFACRLYFDDLLNYNNDSTAKTDSLLEQYAALIELAERFINEIDNIGQNYLGNDLYVVEFAENTALNIQLDVFQHRAHRDRIVSVFVDFNIQIKGECAALAAIDPTTRFDFPPLNDDYEKRGTFAVTGWDTLLDDVIDNDAQAEFIGGLGGTFRSYQFLKNSKSEVLTEGTVTIRATARYKYKTTLPVEDLGTFTGEFGDLLSDAAKWITAEAIYNYFGLSNPIAHSGLVTLDKQQLQDDRSRINFDAQEVVLEIGYQKDNIVTTNTNNKLTIPTRETEGNLNFIFYLLQTSDRRVLWTEFFTESSSLSGLVQWGLDRFFTKRFTNLNSVIKFATYAVLDEGTAPFPTLYIAGQVTTSTTERQVFEIPITGLDSNDNYTFGTPLPTTIMLTGATSAFLPFAALEERINGKPVFIATRTPGTALTLKYWTGTVWQDVRLGGGFLENILRHSGDFKVSGNKVYCSYISSNGRVGVMILQHPTNPLDTANWSVFVMNETTGVVIPTAGNGDTALMNTPYHIALDTVNTVNGEPRIYISSLAYDCVYLATANVVEPTLKSHWNITIPIGSVTASGNNDGQGNAATFTNIRGIIIDQVNNLLILGQGAGGHNLRFGNSNPNDAAYLTFSGGKGDFGVSSTTDFEEK